MLRLFNFKKNTKQLYGVSVNMPQIRFDILNRYEPMISNYNKVFADYTKIEEEMIQDKFPNFKAKFTLSDFANRAVESMRKWPKIDFSGIEAVKGRLIQDNSFVTKDNFKFLCVTSREAQSEGFDIGTDELLNFAMKAYWKYASLGLMRSAVIEILDEETLLSAMTILGWDTSKYKPIRKEGVNGVILKCPACDHADFFVGLDRKRARCWSSQCTFSEAKSIWKVFIESSNLNEYHIAEKLYNALIVGSEVDYVKAARAERKNGLCNEVGGLSSEDNLELILADCKQEPGVFKQLNELGYPDELLIECGVLYRDNRVSSYARSNHFRRRFMFSILDDDGILRGFQGRSIYGEKERDEYVNTDNGFKIYHENYPRVIDKLKKKIFSTSGFNKSKVLYLINKYTDSATEIDTVVICEGEKDAIRVYGAKQKGVAAVATFGKEIYKDQEVLIGMYFWGTKVVLAFDADRAGAIANLKAYVQLKNSGMIFKDIQFAIFGGGAKDFGDVFGATFDETNDKVRNILNQTVGIGSYIDYCRNVIGLDIERNNESKKYFDEILKLNSATEKDSRHLVLV